MNTAAYQAEHYHAGTWWASGPEHSSQSAAAYWLQHNTVPQFCKDGKVRIVRVTREERRTVAWQGKLGEKGK